ncbi:hypothetical protein BRD18_03670 [Halobacteriales archaeon SW_7_71_33]|nr:MAG: hypothetical protein BRD18_03670 [Halobacteriales archaeon SW_7_71_33]
MPHACTDCGRTFPDGSKEMLSGCPDCGGNKFRYHPESVSDADTEGEGEEGPSPRSPPDPDDEGIPARDQGVVDRATTTVREWVSQRSSGPAPAPPSGAADARDEPSAPATDGATTSSSESASNSPEDTAQADARTGVADPDEIPDSPPDSDPTPATPVGGDGETSPAAGATPEAPAADEPAADRDGPAANRDESTASSGARTRDRRAREHNARDRAVAEPADPASTPGASNLAQLREELNEQFESIKIVEPGEYELNLMDLYDREEYIVSLKEDGRYAIEVPETWRDPEDAPE